MSWPVGVPGDLKGIVDRTSELFIKYDRTAHGATQAEEQTSTLDEVDSSINGWNEASEELELLEALGTEVDLKGFLAGEVTPVFFGSALTNFGVRLLIDAVVDLAPSPASRYDVNNVPRPVEAPFSAFAFKVQANTDKAHRDRIAYVRVCSGHFEQGMSVTQSRTDRPFATKYAHYVRIERSTVEEAWPGDVVASSTQAMFEWGTPCTPNNQSNSRKFQRLRPNCFEERVKDTNRFKQFRRGLVQLDEGRHTGSQRRRDGRC